MTSRLLAIIILSLGMMTNGCMYSQKTALHNIISSSKDSPVRIYISDQLEHKKVNQVLILPPLGVESIEMQKRIQRSLYSAAQRRFSVPVRMIPPDSDYAPYIGENNLLVSDGTLNFEEISIIGDLMQSDYVICPQVFVITPYHPQRLDIRLLLVESKSETTCAEISCVVDASDQAVINYFKMYNEDNAENEWKEDDLSFDIKSPTAFQSFVADICCSAIAQKLPL